MSEIFQKCEQFFIRPKVISGEERMMAASLFASVSPPRNAGPWIEGGDRRYLQFSSNDYLGLAMHEEVLAAVCRAVDDCGIASPMGSRLMTGTTTSHLELERKLAVFKRCESAVVFPSGAMAMMGTLACLGGPRDLLIFDEKAHASLVIGGKASGAQMVFFRHNDLDHLESILRKPENRRPRAIIVDGIYSMDGDMAPLVEMVELKNRYGARLIVDDAHGTGVLGESGRGTAAHLGVEDQIDLHAGTFSKAVGTIGGFVAGPSAVIEYVRFHAPTFIFSKSMPMAVVAATRVSLQLLEKADDRRERLWENKRRVQEGLMSLGFDIGQTTSPITPVQFADNEALRVAYVLRNQFGIWVAPVVYPAVPFGKSILRLIPTALHTESDVRYLVESFAAVRGKLASAA
jgi:8-amino-7-oxononanoate synthase